MSNQNQLNIPLKTVKLVGGSPWGFRLKGGKEFGEPLKIDTITAGGKASNSILSSGQFVVEINGVNVVDHRHDDAKNLIIGAGSSLTLVISDSIVHSSVKNILENDKSFNKSISNISDQKSTQSSLETVNNNINLQNNSSTLDKIPNRSSSKAFNSDNLDNSRSNSVSATPVTANLINNPTKNNSLTEPQITDRQSETGLTSVPKNPSNYFQKIQMSLDVDSYGEPGNEKLHITPVNQTPTSSPIISPNKSTITPTVSPSFNTSNNSTKPIDLSAFKNNSNFNILSSDSKLNQLSDNKNVIENKSKVIAINGRYKCRFCDEFIKGHGLQIMEKYYHVEHVVCYKCHIDLKPMNFFEDDDKLICEKCCTVNSPKCKACHQPLITNYLKASDGCYHEKCFICATCQRSLVNKGFLCSDSKVFCSECYENSFCPKCDKCFKPIKGGDTYVESQNKSYHSECFTCKVCNKSLASGKYFLKNGDSVCQIHV